MTKTQAKKNIREILEKLADLREFVDELKSEVEDTIDSIEPYEGCNDLTPEQEDRQAWFDELNETLDSLIDGIDSPEYELEEKND